MNKSHLSHSETFVQGKQQVVVIVLSLAGIEVARQIVRSLPGASMHGFLAEGKIADCDVSFVDVANHLRRLFTCGCPIIGVCSASILIRALAPVLVNKQHEPPVLAVSADGHSVVPLLGSHRGANALAKKIAHLFNISPSITTTSDVLWDLALDVPPTGWKVANPNMVKTVLSALVNGKQVTLKVDADNPDYWIAKSDAPFIKEPSRLTVHITDRSTLVHGDILVLHPPILAVGVGCVRGASSELLVQHTLSTLAKYGLASQSVAVVASLEVKADEPAICNLASKLDVPTRFFSSTALENMTSQLLTPSQSTFEAVGCHGVAEAAALLAAGPGATLIVSKQRGYGVTCAIARSSNVINPTQIGRARGQLNIVGIGPGSAELRTQAASTAIATATHVVGYSLYLDLLGNSIKEKIRHETPIGAEIARVSIALNLAGSGENVALVCSGDAGIYALATLVFDLMSRARREDWNTVDIQVIPGISAMQIAAARAGAILGNDFCAISLSDLLTPWSVIVRRLHSVAETDFVVALYNPTSKKRYHRLIQAREILLSYRSARTPVVSAKNLGRGGEDVIITSLGELNCRSVDMLTTILVGNSNSQSLAIGSKQWVYTPRGYTALRSLAPTLAEK